MTNLKKFITMIEEFERDLGIWGDIIGGVCLVAIFVGLFVLV